MATRETVTVYSLSARYLEMRRMIDAGYSDVHAALQDDTMPGWSWRATWIVSGTSPASEVDPGEMCAEFSIEELRAQLASSPGAAELRTCDCGVTNLHLAGAMVAPVNPCACPGELVRAAEVAPSTEWIETRRGLVGLCEVRTARPGELAPFVTWVWFTEAGDTGEVDGSDARAMAITSAYVAMVRAGRQLAGEVAK